MWNFFRKEPTALEIKREKQYVCQHVFHVISEYQADTDLYQTRYDMQPHNDLYCPICDFTKRKVLKRETEAQLKKQHIRRLYNDGELCDRLNCLSNSLSED